MEELNKLEVKIQGRQYTIVASEPAEYIYKICTYVDKQMNAISTKNSRLSMDMTAVLTAINIADELHKVQVSEDNLRRQIISYDSETKKSEEKAKDLELQVTELTAKLAEKEKELTEFMKQF